MRNRMEFQNSMFISVAILRYGTCKRNRSVRFTARESDCVGVFRHFAGWNLAGLFLLSD